MQKIFLTVFVVLIFAALSVAQVPVAVGVQILKAEDARRYDDVVRKLLSSPDAKIRERAALAAGRIGDERAVIDLVPMLADSSTDVRAMAAFAIGEVESIKWADSILSAIKVETGGSWKMPVLARVVEAAGKIAAANPKDEKSKLLGNAILSIVNGQAVSPSPADVLTVRLGLTALLRARPEGADAVTAKFLTDPDPALRAAAANTLARIRAKNANPALREMLQNDVDAVARSRAASALGAADDKEAFDLLRKAAGDDPDSRVRVSAIRSLGSLKNAKAAERLIELGKVLLAKWTTSKSANPPEKNELLEIATTVSKLLAGTEESRAAAFLKTLIVQDQLIAPEFATAWVRVTPSHILDFQEIMNKKGAIRLSKMGFIYQAMIEAASAPDSDRVAQLRDRMKTMLKEELTRSLQMGLVDILPDSLRAAAKIKPDNLQQVLISALSSKDLFVRATAAEIVAGQPSSQESLDALNIAFDYAFQNDKASDDAVLATLDALFKLDKRKSASALAVASASTDYLVRKKALEMLKDDAFRDVEMLPPLLAAARQKKLDQVLPLVGSRSKLGVILNTDADYRRALSRKNGSVKAVLTTEKGVFTIVFNPEEAPLTVDNWVKLARSGYFNGLEVHRVVPNFVMQDGDPRGDGNGGPGWSIRCEINMLPFDRGAVGMALSGKDTGGSQWFVDHSPQPHLDGGYTVFGHVNETDMKVVDNIVRGDKILKVTIVEGKLPQKSTKNAK